LEDVASRFRRPCILDVKVGRRVWDDFAERDKIERERKKYPPQEILGFRIIGMRVSSCYCKGKYAVSAKIRSTTFTCWWEWVKVVGPWC
jgi:hypothetical protein